MRKVLPRLITLIWITALFAGVGLSAFLIQGQLLKAGELPPTPTGSFSPAPSLTPSTSLIPVSPTTTLPTLIPASSTPDIPQPIIIGFSVAGNPLEVYQFGDGPIEKMIIFGIHGGYEWNTVALADKMIIYLQSHPEIIPEDHTLYYLRVLNPDGLARSRGFGGRANENNVDLNRNFPSNWQAEWPRPGCWDYIPITGGSGPGSEPETRALIEFVESHDLQAFISYHSAALGIFPGGQPPDPTSLALAEALAGVSDYPYPPIDAGCAFTGQLVDWISNQGIPGVDVELTTHQDTDFEINLAILSVFLDWSYAE
jgi:protein MpaA